MLEELKLIIEALNNTTEQAKQFAMWWLVYKFISDLLVTSIIIFIVVTVKNVVIKLNDCFTDLDQIMGSVEYGTSISKIIEYIKKGKGL
jgi:hypothetical protein